MNQISRWNRGELQPLQQFKKELNEVFDHFFDESPLASRSSLFNNAESFIPAMNIEEKENSYLFEVEVPGVDPKDVDIELSGNVLTIKGEKTKREEKKDKNDKMYMVEHSYGSFYRTFTLPANVNTDDITAENKNGMLYISVPKSQISTTHRIDVKNVEK